MRTRLIVVFLVPLVGVLLALGGAYAWSAARSVQQEFYAERLGDLGYFVTSARQALRSGNATVIEGEIDRYHELYGGAFGGRRSLGHPVGVARARLERAR